MPLIEIKKQKMKKILLALTLIIGLTTTFAQNNLKFAHFNYKTVTDSLFTKLQADAEINSFAEGRSKTIQELQTIFERDYNFYMTQRDSLSKFSQEMKEKALQEQQEIIQLKQETFQNDLQIYNERYYAPIEKNLKKAIEIVAKKNSLNYVFEETTLMFVDGGLDLTEQIKIELIGLEKARLAASTN